MIKWIVFNGPPKCGKSTAAAAMRARIWEAARKTNASASVHVDSFAAPMKHFIATMLGEKYMDMNKDKMRPELMGRSVRELLIHMSEHYMKDRYGEDIFARTLMHRNLKNVPAPDFVVIDDGGFEVEKDALDKPYIIQLHREGCTFKGDSRCYWEPPRVGRMWKLRNDGTHEELYAAIAAIAETIVNDV